MPADYFVFTSSAGVSIPDSGPGSPYPSEIEVNNIANVIGLTVQINGLSHSWPGDIELLLQGPKGQMCILMAICGGGNPSRAVSGIDLNIDDTALQDFPYVFVGDPQLTNGSYRPTNNRDGETPWSAPAPSDGQNAGIVLSAFNGKDPVGTWRLWVYDVRPSDSGGFDNWSLTFLADSTISSQTITPNGITSSESFGAPLVVGGIRPDGIPSRESFGSITVNVTASPAGIPTQESFGTISVQNSISPNGIPTSESFGTPAVTLNITPSGIPSGQAFGTIYITDILAHSFTPNGIASSETFGTLSIGVFNYIGSTFLYNASHWSSPYFFLEFFAKAISGSVVARLKSSSGFVVNNSTVTASTSFYERFRSPAFILEDGLTYQVQVGKSGADSGAWVSAKLINFDGPFGNGAGLGVGTPSFVSDVFDPGLNMDGGGG